MINSFRNRLRFSNHLLVQLAKLYLSAMANAFIYSDPQRASHAYLTLPVTSLLQLAAALVPSLAVYRLEAGMRRWAASTVAAGTGRHHPVCVGGDRSFPRPPGRQHGLPGPDALCPAPGPVCREFVSAQVAAGMLQLPPAASQPSTALLAEHSSK